MQQQTNAELAHEWIDTYAHPSISGQGGDDALYHVAVVLYYGFDLGQGALDLLRHYNATKCSPAWPDARLAYKIKQAAGAAQKHAPGGLARWMLRKKGLRTVYHGEAGNAGAAEAVAAAPQQAQVKRLEFNRRALEREVHDVPEMIDAEWLARHSPVPVADVTPQEFLNALYPKGARILIFTNFYSQGDFAHVCGGSSWRLGMRPGVLGVKSPLPRGGREGVWFLNQPVTGKWEPNRRQSDEYGRPKMSRRSGESVAAWTYLVLESDDAPGNLWVRLLVKLPIPIVAIYTSAGRSIHALVRVNAPNKPWWDQYKELITPLFSLLGADPAAITAVRLTRLPGCFRDGKLQRLLFLHPGAPEDTPILWQEGF